MKKFKPGDRVSVYGRAFNNTWCNGFYATVLNPDRDGWLRVRCDCTDDPRNRFDVVHPKQCRRLLPKKKSGAV